MISEILSANLPQEEEQYLIQMIRHDFVYGSWEDARKKVAKYLNERQPFRKEEYIDFQEIHNIYLQ